MEFVARVIRSLLSMVNIMESGCGGFELAATEEEKMANGEKRVAMGEEEEEEDLAAIVHGRRHCLHPNPKRHPWPPLSDLQIKP
ncbi:uncharacterized protein G2W53_018647 [Senna tora]|uniref:Uncharacterized protein n=1 Tax=Senna tora TaxID=362788 RepID=A0A834TSK2_9FABA|nr:uncharacterized protein G2W53_018647 [Senna tora]